MDEKTKRQFANMQMNKSEVGQHGASKKAASCGMRFSSAQGDTYLQNSMRTLLLENLTIFQFPSCHSAGLLIRNMDSDCGSIEKRLQSLKSSVTGGCLAYHTTNTCFTTSTSPCRETVHFIDESSSGVSCPGLAMYGDKSMTT